MHKHDDYCDYWEDQEKRRKEKWEKDKKWREEHIPPIIAPFHEWDEEDVEDSIFN